MKKAYSKSLSIMLIISLMISIIGIFNVDNSFAASKKKIHLKEKTISVTVGQTHKQKLLNKNGKTIKATKVKWKSKNTAVATINKKGSIVAKGEGSAIMTAKYKGKTYKFSVNVSKANKPPILPANLQLYNYILNYGYSVNSSYSAPGNRCIEASANNVVYIISINTNDPTKLYFSSCKTIPDPGKYADTKEFTNITYNMGGLVGAVSFSQLYYTSSSSSSYSFYVSEGIITYASYTAAPYYNERGITNITKGMNHTPVEVGSYDSKALVEGVNVTTAGVDRLLSSILNIRLRDIGFSNL